MSDEARWPLTDHEKQNLQRIIDRIAELDGAIGGWTRKAECRETGLSMHVKFDKKQHGIDTAMAFLTLLEQAPGLLRSACERLLEATDLEVKA